MAQTPQLLRCPACGGMVAATAASCPHCGYLPPQAKKGLNVTAVALGFGGLMIAGGSFLPWITVSSIISLSRSGLDGGGDGLVTLGIGTVVVLIALFNFNSIGIDRWSRLASLAAGAGGLALFAVDGADVANRVNAISGTDVNGSIGAGLFVVAAGSAVVIATALFGFGRGSATAR